MEKGIILRKQKRQWRTFKIAVLHHFSPGLSRWGVVLAASRCSSFLAGGRQQPYVGGQCLCVQWSLTPAPPLQKAGSPGSSNRQLTQALGSQPLSLNLQHIHLGPLACTLWSGPMPCSQNLAIRHSSFWEDHQEAPVKPSAFLYSFRQFPLP